MPSANAAKGKPIAAGAKKIEIVRAIIVRMIEFRIAVAPAA